MESAAATPTPTAARAHAGSPPQVPQRGERALACRMCGSRALESLGPVKGYSFRACRRCQFIFTPLGGTEPTRVADDGFYCNVPEEGWAQEAGFLQPAFERLGQRRLSILDFGAGESKIPGILRRQGHRAVAVDLRPPRKPHPDRWTGNILELPLHTDQFDLVYSFQVFEHLERPAPVLRRLIDVTRDDGWILIHTDMEMPEREAGGFCNWWYVMPPMHCSYYRHETFKVFFEDRPEELIWGDEKRVLIHVRKP